MWYYSFNIAKLEFCLIRTRERYTSGRIRLDKHIPGEIYVHWLEFELVISAPRALKRLQPEREIRNTEGDSGETHRERRKTSEAAPESHRRISKAGSRYADADGGKFSFGRAQ